MEVKLLTLAHGHHLMQIFDPRLRHQPLSDRWCTFQRMGVFQLLGETIADVRSWSTSLPSYQMTICRWMSKQAASGLLDRLIRDALQSATKEGYIKIASMLGDIADARTPWMVDILTCSTDVDCNNRFCRPPSLFSYHPPSYAQQASSFVPYRWHLPQGGLHIWGIRQNSSVVDESLPKQQKELLCQQSAASQRKLSAFQRSFSNSTASSPANRGSKSELDDD